MKIKTKQDALYEVIEEIVAILNYQLSIPLEHKKDLAEKFDVLRKVTEHIKETLNKGE